MASFRGGLGCAIAATMALAVAGCGASPEPLYPVEGKVMFVGKPATGAVVSFHKIGADDAVAPLIPSAVVGPDGSFRLDCGARGPGAPAGNYAVLVRWPEEPKAAANRPNKRAKDKKLPKDPADRLMGRYAVKEMPMLKAEVKAEAQAPLLFEIKDLQAQQAAADQ